MEIPDFHEKYLELGEEVNFLMVSFPVFYDTESNAATTYGGYSLPTTYFIDAASYVIAQASGAIDSAML